MSLQFHWESRFLTRQDPRILKAQRDHLENLTSDLQAALNCLGNHPDRAAAALTQKVLHPFCHLLRGTESQVQGAAAVAARLAGHAAENPSEWVIVPTAYCKARDIRDNWKCVIQECQITLLTSSGAQCNPSQLTLIWKPMTNGDWRLFVFATSQEAGADSTLGFRHVLYL